jgi:hypothetical protein
MALLRRLGVVCLVSGSVGVLACSSATGGSGFDSDGSGGSAAGTGSGATGGGFSTGGSGGGGGLTEEPPCNPSDPNVDADGDGWTTAQGDCNDCTDQMNPGAFDFPGNGIDEDCNGTPDDEPTSCDQGLPIADPDPMNAARAMGLCRVASGDSWGVVSARFVKADGTDGAHPDSRGNLPSFGPVSPREGASMFVISSGTARAPGQPGYQSPEGANMGVRGFAPTGFPIDSPSCAPVKTDADKNAQDPSGIELVIKAPTNAKMMRFDFNFYTYEFPDYVCSRYNDFFVALVNPAPPNAQNSNISFDSEGNPISVNNSLLEVCTPQTAPAQRTDPFSPFVQKTFACPQGPGDLQGTGFEGRAATGWLSTSAPITAGGTIQIRFAVWDMGSVLGVPDHILDSTVLIDNFGWDVNEGSEGPTTRPVPK